MTARKKYDLAEIARAYEAAIQAHEPTTDTVARAFGLTYNAAAKAVMRARAAGHLPPVRKGTKKGVSEHVPTIAVIHRNHSTERKFLVCECCLTPWPCRFGNVPSFAEVQPPPHITYTFARPLFVQDIVGKCDFKETRPDGLHIDVMFKGKPLRGTDT